MSDQVDSCVVGTVSKFPKAGVEISVNTPLIICKISSQQIKATKMAHSYTEDVNHYYDTILPPNLARMALYISKAAKIAQFSHLSHSKNAIQSKGCPPYLSRLGIFFQTTARFPRVSQ
ncbi:hypothetical protein JCGZ_26714 [Jatropha curcas]|uniref:Uncharacterized protein n=1 Tax=Jatropha curcas TaxID=180498 RepID=A0A067JV57_JATCU|nr:hypothetical protein JCGZ_26714 [Jatropha curcas]